MRSNRTQKKKVLLSQEIQKAAIAKLFLESAVGVCLSFLSFWSRVTQKTTNESEKKEKYHGSLFFPGDV
jgi:hypothetical protein